MQAAATREDPHFFALRDLRSGQPGGMAAFLRIDPAQGCMELGAITLAPGFQRGIAATEAWYLMMDWAFEAGYRRFEWKCNAANLPSRRAAQRLGFSFEGIFRQAMIVKGRNRDTAWFSVIDLEWPRLRTVFGSWLSPDNFDAAGWQKVALSDLTRPLLATRDPAVVRPGPDGGARDPV